MKKLKPFILIIFISVVLQLIVLTILDKYYLVDNYKFEVTYLDSKGSKENKELENKLESKDNNYAIYYNEKTIKLINNKTKEENYIRPEEGNKLESIKWSEDSNEILIDEKQTDNSCVENYTYKIAENKKIERVSKD